MKHEEFKEAWPDWQEGVSLHDEEKVKRIKKEGHLYRFSWTRTLIGAGILVACLASTQPTLNTGVWFGLYLLIMALEAIRQVGSDVMQLRHEVELVKGSIRTNRMLGVSADERLVAMLERQLKAK